MKSSQSMDALNTSTLTATAITTTNNNISKKERSSLSSSNTNNSGSSSSSNLLTAVPTTGLFGSMRKGLLGYFYPEAHDASENIGGSLEAYYDQKLGRWVFPGEVSEIERFRSC